MNKTDLNELNLYFEIPAWDAKLDQAARYGISPAISDDPNSKEVTEEVGSNVGEVRSSKLICNNNNKKVTSISLAYRLFMLFNSTMWGLEDSLI